MHNAFFELVVVVTSIPIGSALSTATQSGSEAQDLLKKWAQSREIGQDDTQA
jgi:hypothetical protein